MIVFRFLYINIFAFILLCLSVIVFFIPINIFIIILKILFVLILLIISIGIFCQWKAKNRKLITLILRNKKIIRIDTFKNLRETPCGWVLADIALRELRKNEIYKAFSKKQWKEIRNTVLGIKYCKTCN